VGGGSGGAIYHSGFSPSTVKIVADTRDVVFYGNRDNPGNTGVTPNAIRFSPLLGAVSHLEVDAGSRDVLMFDPLFYHGIGTPSVDKNGTGTWYLGGVSEYVNESHWNINNGALVLTTVDYGAGDVAAQVVINDPASTFTVSSGATLAGAGEIITPSMTFAAGSTVMPVTVKNTGPLATSLGNDALAALIDTAQTPDFGTLKLSGDVTMNGATYVVQASGNGNSLIDITGNLTFSGSNTVELNLVDDTVGALTNVNVMQAAGVITGSDPTLVVPGYLVTTGTASVSGSNLQVTATAPTLAWNDSSQTGGLYNAHGYFDLSTGQTFTVTSNLTNHTVTGSANFNPWNGNPTWDGMTLTKRGAGTLSLNGVNTYTGGTTVQAGTLRVGSAPNSPASVASMVTVQAGATIGGHGRLAGGLTMLPGSFLSPGSSLGTLTAVGDVDLGGVTYELEIDAAGNSDHFMVQAGNGQPGNVTLTGGTLRILPFGTGDWAMDSTTTYTSIIQAGGQIIGTFDPNTGIQNTLAFLTPSLIYNANSVDLIMVRSTTGGGGGGFGACGWCQSSNQAAVTSAINSLPITHAVAAATLGMTNAQALAAADNLTGEIYGSTRSAMLGNHAVRNAMLARMQSQGQVSTDERLWVSTWGNTGHVSGNSNAVKADHSGFGLAIGGDFRINDKLAAGAVLAYEDGRVKNGANRNSRSDVDGYSVGGWLAADVSGVQVRGGLIYSQLDVDTRRSVFVPGLQGTAKSSYDGHKTQVFAEASKAFQVNTLRVSPYLGLTQTWLHSEAARETGSLAALDVRSQSDSVLHSTVGVRVAYQLPTAKPVAVTADLGWSHAFGDTDGTTSNRFAGAGNRFSVQGTAVGKNTAQIGAGVQAQLSPNAALSVGYQGQFGSKVSSHSAGVQVKVRF